ncbi:MAG: hypothetical protein ACP5TV_11640, partial [Anaerolineae bacterium]
MKRIHHVSERLASALGMAAFLALLTVLFIWTGPSRVQAQTQEQTLPHVPMSDATSIWGGFQPSGWATTTAPACSVIVTDSLGLEEATAVYRYSANGGSSWSAWSSAGLSISGDTDTTKYITVTGVTFIQSGTDNLIQFRILDLNGDPDTSPVFVVKVDSQAPAAPTGLAVSPAGWSPTNSFTLTWTNPADTSGIAGVYYKLDAPPTSSGDGTLVEGAGISSLSSLIVSGNGAHPIYIWLKDSAGNANHSTHASATLYLDQDLPSAPSAITSTTHSTAAWSQDNYVQVNWSGASDPTSGIAGYAVAWDQSPGTLPAPITTTIGLTGTSPILPDGSSHYAHLRA